MTHDIEGYLADLSDSELIASFKQAETDLAEAAAQQPNSEWHQSCFAGLLVYGQELNKRGIQVLTLH